MDMPKWMGKKTTWPQPYTKNFKQLRKARSGRGGLHGEEQTKWLSSATWSALKTYMRVTL